MLTSFFISRSDGASEGNVASGGVQQLGAAVKLSYVACLTKYARLCGGNYGGDNSPLDVGYVCHKQRR